MEKLSIQIKNRVPNNKSYINKINKVPERIQKILNLDFFLVDIKVNVIIESIALFTKLKWIIFSSGIITPFRIIEYSHITVLSLNNSTFSNLFFFASLVINACIFGVNDISSILGR